MVRFSAKVIPKKQILASPQSFADRPVVVLETTESYLGALRRFAAEHDMNNLLLTMDEYPQDWTERAKNFMFAIRDEIAQDAEGLRPTKEYKQHLYESAKLECGFVDEKGKLRSLRDLSREEVWQLTHLMLDWAQEAQIDVQRFAAEEKELRDSK